MISSNRFWDKCNPTPVYLTLPLEAFCNGGWAQRARMLSLLECQEHDDTFIHLDTIPALDRQTDRQTDGQIDGRTEMVEQYRAVHAVYDVCWHTINCDMWNEADDVFWLGHAESMSVIRLILSLCMKHLSLAYGQHAGWPPTWKHGKHGSQEIWKWPGKSQRIWCGL